MTEIRLVGAPASRGTRIGNPEHLTCVKAGRLAKSAGRRGRRGHPWIIHKTCGRKRSDAAICSEPQFGKMSGTNFANGPRILMPKRSKRKSADYRVESRHRFLTRCCVRWSNRSFRHKFGRIAPDPQLHHFGGKV